MNLKLFAATTVAASVALVGSAFAWDVIAVRQVADRLDRDVIVLDGPRRFDALRLCVGRSPVHFIDVDVHYANGGHQDIAVAARINPGECTRRLELPGDDRNITRIVLRYEEDSIRNRPATVRVLAE